MSSQKILSISGKFLWYALALLGLCFLAFYLLKPITDPDFFWHLKTGEWILQHKTLPHTDPFTLAPPSLPDPNQKFILTSYWLYQLIISIVFNLAGFSGIIFIRFLLVAVVIIVVARNLKLADTMVLSLAMLLATLFLKEYTLDRPQTFSFIFFMILLLMLFRFITDQAEERHLFKYCAFTSLLMLAWANSHGGYLVGQLTLLIVLATEGLKFLRPCLRPMTRSRYSGLIIIVTVSLFFSFLNPNHLHGIGQIFSVVSSNSFSSSINTEYFSVLQKWRNSRSVIFFIYLFIAAITAVVALLSHRRSDITMLAILACTGFFGFMHIRYFPFFMITVLIFIGQWCAGKKADQLVRSAIILVTISSICLFAYDESVNYRTIYKSKWVLDDDFPVSAADFLAENHGEGGIFSSYYWGGYLIWRLAPAMKPLIDSRNMDIKRYFEHAYCDEVIENSSGADDRCNKMFQKYGINYVVLRILDTSGTVHPLLYTIEENPYWAMIYKKENVVIFQRIK